MPDADSADHLPVFEPLYSRSSIMTFVLTEVLLQALTLMNSPQQRGRRAHAETPRRLRRIVLTLPTGMPLAERLIFRKRAEAARDLVWMMMGWKLDDAAGAGAARADRLGRGELHPARLSLHRGRAQFRRRRPPLLPDHRASRAASRPTTR